MLLAKTKIICTIGPACNSIDRMLELIAAGMNVARLNFSHGTHDAHQQVIDNLKQARRISGQPLAIMLDTKGPEIRLGKVPIPFKVQRGQRLKLVAESVEGNAEQVSLTPSFILEQIPLGTKILIDNGYLTSYVVSKDAHSLTIAFDNSGEISANKGINIPNLDVGLPAVTAKDIVDIRFGCQNGVDLIAASFVRSAEQVLEIKNLLQDSAHNDIQVLAKIENSRGIDNFDSILQVADGIMIARGDLGVEIPLSQVPKLQKMMIRKCYLAGKPAVTATQMLESMILNPRPTRAEVSDVANAIYDSTSAVMLSGETAIGLYSIDAVKMMKNIILETEKDLNYHSFFDQHTPLTYHDVPSSVTLAAVKTAYSSKAKAIFAFSHKGTTARLISRLRPAMPILVLTPRERTYHQLAISWGVIPIRSENCHTIEAAFKSTSNFALEKGHVAYGDLVIVTAGSPFNVSGTTNMMIVENIGDVLVRGEHGFGQRIWGNCTTILSPESKQPYQVKGLIAVITKCDERYEPLLKQSIAILLQNNIDDSASENHALALAKKWHKPLIIRADAACKVLNEGQLVTLDPEKGLVYKGAVL